MTHLLIIGGSDAGISAALRAREVNAAAAVTVVVADAFPNYSICGLPFFLSGEVPDWRNLAHRTASEIESEGIRLLLKHTAQTIDPTSKTVQLLSAEGKHLHLPYDKLVIATGAVPSRPAIAGLELPGVFFFGTMAASFAIHQHLLSHKPRLVVIIGGGYSGLEMAEALSVRGVATTIIEQAKTVLKTVDTSLGEQVGAVLKHNGVQVNTSVTVEAIKPEGTQLRVFGSPAFDTVADMVLISVGVTPLIDLAKTAGLTTGMRSALKVNRQMETNLPDIYAAGDCVETWHRVRNQAVYLPLVTTAHKQGRVAGENAVGGQQSFAGSLGTQVVKIFDLAIAQTGLNDTAAAEAGFDPVTVETEVWDHKVYYPGAHPLRLRVTGDRQNGRLLGAQMAGHYQAEVAKRIDIFATALFHGMTVEALSALDLSYTPPLSSPWDPVQMSAQAWSKQGFPAIVQQPESLP